MCNLEITIVLLYYESINNNSTTIIILYYDCINKLFN